MKRIARGIAAALAATALTVTATPADAATYSGVRAEVALAKCAANGDTIFRVRVTNANPDYRTTEAIGRGRNWWTSGPDIVTRDEPMVYRLRVPRGDVGRMTVTHRGVIILNRSFWATALCAT